MIISGFLLLILVLLTGPLWVYLSGQLDLKTHWSSASRESTGTAPSPQRFPEASVRVYYARSFHWRGAFGVHSWLAIKEKNGSSYQIFQVIGWRLFGNHSSVDVHWGDPARYWYGEKPILLGEISGADAEKAIPKIRDAAENYPYAWNYRVWPGPNSNTFISHLIRSAENFPFGLPPLPKASASKSLGLSSAGIPCEANSTGPGWGFWNIETSSKINKILRKRFIFY